MRDGTAQRRNARTMVEGALTAIALLVIVCFLAPTAADADLWGHLTFGRDIVHAWHVHTVDPYSFASDRPWINHEWLAEAIMWLAYAAAGAAGLVALKLLLACVAGASLLDSWRPHGLRPPWRDGLLFATALGTWPLLATIRPQVFSVTMFAILLWLLDRVRARRLRWLIALPPLFAVWVNLHGGWVVGAGTLAVVVLSSWLDPAWTARDRVLLLGSACAAALATLCNPYGLSMLAFLADTVRPARADISEWRSAAQVPAIVLLIWIVPTALALVAVLRGRLRRESIAVIALLAVGSFRVVRLVGFYALAVGFLAAPLLARAFSGGTQETAPRRPARLARAAAAVAMLVAAGVALFGRSIPMHGAWLPDAESAIFIRSHALHGRMLTWFDYGEFAIWQFSPAIRVSMDGRRETVYSDEMRARQARIFRDEPGAIDELARLAPDYVWLPGSLPVVVRLEAAGWTPIFKGSRSVLLSKHPMTVASASYRGGSGPRVFPGP